MRLILQSVRLLAFRLSLLLSITAVTAIPFYEHWYSRFPGYTALTSDTLLVWLKYMGWISTLALIGSLFGKGWKRVLAFVLSLLELYYWLVLSIAV